MSTTVATAAPVAVDDMKTLDAGSIKAACSVTIAGKLVIHGCRVIKQAGKKPWVAMPSRKSGERYYPIIEVIDDRLRQQVADAVLAAWRAPE